MDRFYGSIGYEDTVETSLGVWEEVITVKNYFGNVGRNSRRLESSGSLNDDININNEFSIVADPFAEKNFHKMRYIEFMGTKWKITNVEVKYPRLILTTGGVYNGKQA